jgi:hypothetical protein
MQTCILECIFYWALFFIFVVVVVVVIDFVCLKIICGNEKFKNKTCQNISIYHRVKTYFKKLIVTSIA